MIKSMTGYGRCESIDEYRKIVIDLKSVNHRYSDISVKVPRAYGYIEDKIRDYVASSISRGKVDVFVYIENYTNENEHIMLDKALAENYYNVLCELKDQFNLSEDISLSSLSRFPDIFVTKQEEEDKDKVWQKILSVLKPAVEAFIKMRESEGERMLADLKQRAVNISSMVEIIEGESPEIAKTYSEKLKERMQELLGEFSVDENRLLTEVGIVADHICISEELVRLKSHLTELDRILKEDVPVGRKLDFLVQEINREVNTIGSKANDINIAKTVIELKSEIEKLREQIQNIE